jgi:hypothetical protein
MWCPKSTLCSAMADLILTGGSVCSHLLTLVPCSGIIPCFRLVAQSAATCSCWFLADFSTLKMEPIRSSETSVHTRSARHHIPEDGILHSHCCENLKSYIGYVYMHSVSSPQLNVHVHKQSTDNHNAKSALSLWLFLTVVLCCRLLIFVMQFEK